MALNKLYELGLPNLARLGYIANHYDSTLFLCRTDKGTILLLLYVDNMIITDDDLVAFKNSRIFWVSSLRWKIWDISATSLVLKSLIQQMVFILLRPSVLLNFCLKLDSLIVKLLTLQLNLMCIWLPQEGGKPLSNPSLYRRLIDSLVYLTVIHPDISYDVHQVSQYLSTP